MTLDDENVRISVNLRKLRLLLDRIMTLVDVVQDIDKSVMDLIEDIAPEVKSVLEEHEKIQDKIKHVIDNTEIPDNVIPFMKKERNDESSELD